MTSGHIFRLINLLLLSTLFTVLVPSALLLILPGELGTNLIWLGLGTPLLWTIIMLYAYWDHLPWRPTVVLTTLCIISAIVIISVEAY